MADKEFRVTATVTTLVVFSDAEGREITPDDVVGAFLGYGLSDLVEAGEYSLVGPPTIEP